MLGISRLLVGGALFVFAVMPSTSNYQLNDYSFGNGGGSSSTANYGLEGLSGELNGTAPSSATYTARPGLLSTQLANVPGAPNLSNPGVWYNKLNLIIDTAGNPTDAVFAVAISSDGFATTSYVQSDMTVGPALGTEDYLTYAGWGSGTGVTVVGLQPNTTYSVKVSASRGEFTESGFGPVDTAVTSDVSLTFDIDVATTDTESAPPYNLVMGDLLADTVSSSSDKIWFDIDTNAESGGKLFLYGVNSGLYSSALTYTVNSASVDLSVVSEGFGVQSASAAQSSGGPLSPVSPYDGAGDSVGVIDAAIRQLYTFASPLTSGRASLSVKAKVSQVTPAANDYQDILTIIAAANY